MTKILGAALLIWAVCRAALAIPIASFEDADRLVSAAKDIVVADCISIPTNRPVLVNGHWVTSGFRSGLYKVEIDVLRTLKGERRPGKQIIATIYPMTAQKRYLLYSLGGGVGESGGLPVTDFLAIARLSVVEIPSHFDLRTLAGKDPVEQVQCIFSLRLAELERQLAPLLEEKSLLENVLAGRSDEWFQSHGAVKVGPILDISTRTDDGLHVWLDLGTNRLQWSRSLPGKTGYFYFMNADTESLRYWEFSPCNAARIEDLADKPLKARFYSMDTPGLGRVGWGELGMVQISVGQVVLARTVDEPNKVFIVQIVSQDPDRDRMRARYAVVQQSTPSIPPTPSHTPP